MHPHTHRTVQDWQLQIEKANIIIGDSNLACIPVFTDSKFQIESFPGATWMHITALLCKLSLQQQVERIILSVGLNNCL